jgi:quercetin dioxygenase-like cupin family protein
MDRSKWLTRTLCVAAVLGAVAAAAQEAAGRKELKREDLSGAQGMEVVTSIVEVMPGETLGRHSHHGIESLYVIQGAMIEAPGKEPTMFPTGASVTNLRDVPHAGFKVVGDQPLRMYTVQVVDKGKPLYEWVK